MLSQGALLQGMPSQPPRHAPPQQQHAPDRGWSAVERAGAAGPPELEGEEESEGQHGLLVG